MSLSDRQARTLFDVEDRDSGSSWHCLICPGANGPFRSHNVAVQQGREHVVNAHDESDLTPDAAPDSPAPPEAPPLVGSPVPTEG